MNVFTIGFTKKSAEHFFNELKDNNVKKIIDVRLNNISQLSGFAKKNDLEIHNLKKLALISNSLLNKKIATYQKGIINRFKAIAFKDAWDSFSSFSIDIFLFISVL